MQYHSVRLLYFSEAAGASRTAELESYEPVRVTQHFLLPEEPLPVNRACDGPIAMMPSYVIVDSMRNIFGKDGGECVRS
jgi:hypothetical protein